MGWWMLVVVVVVVVDVDVVVAVHLVVVMALAVSRLHVAPVVVMVMNRPPTISAQTGAHPREVGPGTFDGSVEHMHPCSAAR